MSRRDTRTRIVVVIDVDTDRHTPRELREQARGGWLLAVDRARAPGRIDLTIADELRSAWLPAESRR